ncbi:sulfatase-like hydrolase/transferase [Photobacterium kishitanii]|uniref:sulfatase-like hydrolase/transferase n=1 Tax=Photobacterium kishitanii TaxID=318456 RepID=UPI000B25DCDB|nr:sulfatase-like hydrolase/transferase [Photobacterium kishitanii]
MSISRRGLLKGMAASGAVAATLSAGYAQAATTSKTSSEKALKKPNLVIIFPDEFRAQALGFMQQDPSMTPNIDKFARQGAVLRQAVSNFPLCTPFRGMLMTGQYPYRNGIQGNSHTGVEGQFGGKDFGIELKKKHPNMV